MPNNENDRDSLSPHSFYSALSGSLLLGVAMGILAKSITVGVLVACGVFCSIFSIAVLLVLVANHIIVEELDKKLTKPSES